MTTLGFRVVATGPHGFPGASQIHCQYLRELSHAGAEVHYVGFDEPFLFTVAGRQGVRCHLIQPLLGGAIGPGRAIQSSDVLFTEQLTEQVLRIVASGSPDIHTILWGNYLFPYGQAALAAQRQLISGGKQSRLWITPTGSDVWEVGCKLPYIMKALLRDSCVSQILTYTPQFATEIRQTCGEELRIETLYPIIDFSRFHRIDRDLRKQRRRALGIGDNAFVVTSHSNMRPVKAPNDVVHIALQTAKIVRKPVLLLLIGPEIHAPVLEEVPNFEIRSVGVVQRVEELLQISDLELNCSRHDSFNLSLAEAMACGVPCASTDIVGIAPEIQRSGGGILFPLEPMTTGAAEGRYAGAVKTIAEMARNQGLRNDLGWKAQRGAQLAFSSEYILPKLLALAATDK
jgi:glycosyltransferase involved in cell wall biosynthesis